MGKPQVSTADREAGGGAAAVRQTVESWTDSDTRLSVTQEPNSKFFCTINLLARILLPPEELFDVLTDPANSKLFRSVKRVKSRRVLESDGRGRQVVEVEQLAEWKFLLFRGTFTTRLLVTQDRRASRISFRLAKPGLMRDFAGEWHIQPFTQDVLDDTVNFPARHHGPVHGLAKALHGVQGQLMGHRPDASLVHLRQSVQPAFIPPPPMDALIKRITGKQVQIILEDLRKEVERRNAAKRKQGSSPGVQVISSKSDAASLAAFAHELR